MKGLIDRWMKTSLMNIHIERYIDRYQIIRQKNINNLNVYKRKLQINMEQISKIKNINIEIQDIFRQL